MATKSEKDRAKILIGERLAAARKERGWTLERLAYEIDVSLATARRYERGEDGGLPSYVTLIRAARALDKPLDWFVEGIDQEEGAPA